LTAWVEGRVQGVGFRWWARDCARNLQLAGSATNLADGSVEIVVQGDTADCNRLLDRLRDGSPPGRVARVTSRWSDPVPDVSGFETH
jgi:acylphosphatase